MKITNEQLRRIIKEELEAVLNEDHPGYVRQKEKYEDPDANYNPNASDTSMADIELQRRAAADAKISNAEKEAAERDKIPDLEKAETRTGFTKLLRDKAGIGIKENDPEIMNYLKNYLELGPAKIFTSGNPTDRELVVVKSMEVKLNSMNPQQLKQLAKDIRKQGFETQGMVSKFRGWAGLEQ